jgi:hypothetical protein
LIATCSPAVSRTGSDPTTMLVPAALVPGDCPLPDELAAALLAGGLLAELLLPELQAAARTVTDRAPMTLRASRLVRENPMALLILDGWQ